ncbi:hypothetical protein DEF23_06820 [Marinitenerispora sediminis]|uniref:Uncharacterized protein n=2 Tax=Marinitenerispora sediminis TaxID=1931232 RepID=A0A368T4X5_9ACTN|nr:hypothetical protein DEF28_01240 [Marinitenerispora sediminis]RCV58291.1 hypothetical protein DEF24_13785 [Marinitenerispora sediminis]RCV59678.1 hypothetical protein DEF23_06820 [Marinitenerispora sediminis]
MGIGQLLDYSRHLDIEGLQLALLLPARPPEDLIELLTDLGIACVYETTPSNFERIAPPTPWIRQPQNFSVFPPQPSAVGQMQS